MHRITIQPNQTTFMIPPHTRGDSEFKGHGPNVYVRVTLSVRHGNQLWADVYMRAVETKADWTTAEGTQAYMIFQHPSHIHRILSSVVQDFGYTDTDHDRDVYTFPLVNLMSRIECIGDTAGHEAGTRTGCIVFFHPAELLVD